MYSTKNASSQRTKYLMHIYMTWDTFPTSPVRQNEFLSVHFQRPLVVVGSAKVAFDKVFAREIQQWREARG